MTLRDTAHARGMGGLKWHATDLRTSSNRMKQEDIERRAADNTAVVKALKDNSRDTTAHPLKSHDLYIEVSLNFLRKKDPHLMPTLMYYLSSGSASGRELVANMFCDALQPLRKQGDWERHYREYWRSDMDMDLRRLWNCGNVLDELMVKSQPRIAIQTMLNGEALEPNRALRATDHYWRGVTALTLVRISDFSRKYSREECARFVEWAGDVHAISLIVAAAQKHRTIDVRELHTHISDTGIDLSLPHKLTSVPMMHRSELKPA